MGRQQRRRNGDPHQSQDQPTRRDDHRRRQPTGDRGRARPRVGDRRCAHAPRGRRTTGAAQRCGSTRRATSPRWIPRCPTMGCRRPAVRDLRKARRLRRPWRSLRGPSWCPRSRDRCRRSRPTASATRSRSATATASRRHPGEPVTAQTFKDSIERSLNPRMKSPVAHQFGDIVGAAAYMAGRTRHITGVVARGNTLTIALTARAPDFTARSTQSVFCAVPSNTPIVPAGLRSIPSAGPYRIVSYTPGQGIVLERNPNYHGNRPNRVARIEVAIGIPPRQAVAQVLAGTADFTDARDIDRADVAALAARYGPGSRAARRGSQQYFVATHPQLDFFALNTHRPLFSGARMRQAVNYAIDRTGARSARRQVRPAARTPHRPLPAAGHPGVSQPAHLPTDPRPGEGPRARRRACRRDRRLLRLPGATVRPAGTDHEDRSRRDRHQGRRQDVPRRHPRGQARQARRAIRLAWFGWLPDYLDPDQFLNALLETARSFRRSTTLPTARGWTPPHGSRDPSATWPTPGSTRTSPATPPHWWRSATRSPTSCSPHEWVPRPRGLRPGPRRPVHQEEPRVTACIVAQRLWLTTSTFVPSGSRTKAAT